MPLLGIVVGQVGSASQVRGTAQEPSRARTETQQVDGSLNCSEALVIGRAVGPRARTDRSATLMPRWRSDP
jgi:hypothetical protein